MVVLIWANARAYPLEFGVHALTPLNCIRFSDYADEQFKGAEFMVFDTPHAQSWGASEPEIMHRLDALYNRAASDYSVVTYSINRDTKGVLDFTMNHFLNSIEHMRGRVAAEIEYLSTQAEDAGLKAILHKSAQQVRVNERDHNIFKQAREKFGEQRLRQIAAPEILKCSQGLFQSHGELAELNIIMRLPQVKHKGVFLDELFPERAEKVARRFPAEREQIHRELDAVFENEAGLAIAEIKNLSFSTGFSESKTLRQAQLLLLALTRFKKAKKIQVHYYFPRGVTPKVKRVLEQIPNFFVHGPLREAPPQAEARGGPEF